MNHDTSNGRNVAAVLADMKEEIKEFVRTRLALLKTELQEKAKILKVAAPLAIVGILLLLTAYALFTLAIVCLVYAFLPESAFRWFFAFLAVAVAWSLLGGIIAYFAKREFELRGLMPKKTIDVLKGDKVWIQSEVRNQI
jgi:uncharacterized membrane protein YqjE